LAAKTQSIGITALVVREVEGKTEAQIRQLALKDSVYQNEIVKTGLESASQLKFADETRISVGPNSSIVLDEFVYDPDPGEGSFALQVTDEVFRFFSGNMASSNYKIETPTVTVGVRGTVLVMVTRRDGAVAVILESDDGVDIQNMAGGSVLLDTPGTATVAFADGSMTPPGPPPAWALWRVREMDALLSTAGSPSQPSGPAGPPSQPGGQSEPEPTEVVSIPPEEPGPLDEPDPADEPTLSDDDIKRGQPRAALASGRVPPGQEQANEMAQPGQPPARNDSDPEDADTADPLLIVGDGKDDAGAAQGGRGNNGQANDNKGLNGENSRGGAAGSNGSGDGNGRGEGKGKG
jgi:hypothetical protein